MNSFTFCRGESSSRFHPAFLPEQISVCFRGSLFYRLAFRSFFSRIRIAVGGHNNLYTTIISLIVSFVHIDNIFIPCIIIRGFFVPHSESSLNRQQTGETKHEQEKRSGSWQRDDSRKSERCAGFAEPGIVQLEQSGAERPAHRCYAVSVQLDCQAGGGTGNQFLLR